MNQPPPASGDKKPPKLLDQVRAKLRLLRYSKRAVRLVPLSLEAKYPNAAAN